MPNSKRYGSFCRHQLNQNKRRGVIQIDGKLAALLYVGKTFDFYVMKLCENALTELQSI